jgi:hypothetical protein
MPNKTIEILNIERVGTLMVETFSFKSPAVNENKKGELLALPLMATAHPGRASFGLNDGAQQVQSAFSVSMAASEVGAVDRDLSPRKPNKITEIHATVSTTGITSSNPQTIPKAKS